MGLPYIYPVQIDIIIYKIYQLVGGLPAKFVSPRISRNIFFRMIGNKIFQWRRFQNWSLPLMFIICNPKGEASPFDVIIF